jgi:hypothetical protein
MYIIYKIQIVCNRYIRRRRSVKLLLVLNSTVILGFISRRDFSFQIIYNNSVRTSKETHNISFVKICSSILFRETIAVYCKNHTKHTNTFSGQNAEFQFVETDGIHRNHWAL